MTDNVAALISLLLALLISLLLAFGACILSAFVAALLVMDPNNPDSAMEGFLAGPVVGLLVFTLIYRFIRGPKIYRFIRGPKIKNRKKTEETKEDVL